MLVTLLFSEYLHELNCRLVELVTGSLNFLKYSVSILSIGEDVKILGIEDLAPNVVQAYRLVVGLSCQVEFDALTL